MKEEWRVHKPDNPTMMSAVWLSMTYVPPFFYDSIVMPVKVCQ
jgi:hypothetical protein